MRATSWIRLNNPRSAAMCTVTTITQSTCLRSRHTLNVLLHYLVKHLAPFTVPTLYCTHAGQQKLHMPFDIVAYGGNWFSGMCCKLLTSDGPCADTDWRPIGWSACTKTTPAHYRRSQDTQWTDFIYASIKLSFALLTSTTFLAETTTLTLTMPSKQPCQKICNFYHVHQPPTTSTYTLSIYWSYTANVYKLKPKSLPLHYNDHIPNSESYTLLLNSMIPGLVPS